MVSQRREAVKVEDKELCDYELVFIVSPEVSDDSITNIINSVTQFITNKNGVVSNVEQWGKKKLAYPIKRFLEGNYVLTRLQMSPALINELEANLKISEQIIRHLLVRLDS